MHMDCLFIFADCCVCISFQTSWFGFISCHYFYDNNHLWGVGFLAFVDRKNVIFPSSSSPFHLLILKLIELK